MCRLRRCKGRHMFTSAPPGSLMVSWGDRNTCSGWGHSGSTLPGATPQMNVRFLDWLTPKFPALSTPKRTCIKVHPLTVSTRLTMASASFARELYFSDTGVCHGICQQPDLGRLKCCRLHRLPSHQVMIRLTLMPCHAHPTRGASKRLAVAPDDVAV